MKQRRALSHLAFLLALSIVLFLDPMIKPPLQGGADSPPLAIRGDADGSLQVEVTDAIVLLSYLFLGDVQIPCQAVGDVNVDGVVDVADAIALLFHLFLGTDPPLPLSAFEARLCSEADTETIQRGMLVYETPDPDGNTFACMTCHDLLPDGESPFMRPGHSLSDALGRPSYKNGALDHFLDAANVCRVNWMVTDPWEEAAPEFLDMVSFMNSVSPRTPAPALVFEIVAPAVQGPAQGLPDAGCELFHRSCVICHGNGAQGTERAPNLVFDPNTPLNPDYIRLRVRTSGPPNTVYEGLTGGRMPFWSRDRLSDEQVEDLVAYLTRRPVPQCGEEPGEPAGNVVRSGTLTTGSHGVSGIIEDLDNHKIRLREFYYDGEGSEVYVWLYLEGTIGEGRAIGENLVRPEGWADETFVVDIPEDVTAEMYNAVAIWSVPEGVSFGEGLLTEDGNPPAEGTVVRAGTLETHFHAVSGIIEELDTRNIRIREFFFDGSGIDVRVWLSRQDDARSGYAIGPTLLRAPPGWVNETLVVEIPDHLTPDMYDTVSIWCVPVSVSFGDGILSPVE